MFLTVKGKKSLNFIKTGPHQKKKSLDKPLSNGHDSS